MRTRTQECSRSLVLLVVFTCLGCGDPDPVVEETTPVVNTNVVEEVVPPAVTAQDDPPPDNEAAFQAKMQVAIAQLKSAQFVEAIATLDDAIALQPDSPLGHTALGWMLTRPSRDQDLDEALAEFQKAEQLGDPAAGVWQARVHLERSDLAAARACLEAYFADGLEEGPAWADAHLQRGRTNLRQDLHQEAAQDLDEAERILAALTRDPASPLDDLAQAHLADVEDDLRLARVELLMGLAEHEQAEQAARDLVLESPQDLPLRELLIRILRAAGKTLEVNQQQRIIQDLRRLNTIAGQRSVPIEEVDLLVGSLGALAPEFQRARLLLARACLVRGLHARVLQACQDVRLDLQGDPGQTKVLAEAWFLEGQAYHMQKQAEQAIQCYAKAAELEPGFQRQYEQLRAQIEARMADQDKADSGIRDG